MQTQNAEENTTNLSKREKETISTWMEEVLFEARECKKLLKALLQEAQMVDEEKEASDDEDYQRYSKFRSRQTKS